MINIFFKNMLTKVVETSIQILVSGRLVAPILGVPSIPMSHVDKLGKFGGVDFKRWQQNMIFYLTTLDA